MPIPVEVKSNISYGVTVPTDSNNEDGYVNLYIYRLKFCCSLVEPIMITYTYVE